MTPAKLVAPLVALGLFVASPALAKTKARDAWKQVLKGCAENDLLGKDLLYFGPSNNLGVGSVLRKRQNGYGVRYRTSDLNIPSGVKFLNEGTLAKCSGYSRRTFTLGGGANLENPIAPLNGEVSALLNRGRNVTIGVTHYRWDTLVEGPFESWFKNSADASVKDDLYAPAASGHDPRYVVIKALWISGFTAEVTFDSRVGADVKGKIPPGPVEASNLGFNAMVKWEGNEKLMIESIEPFFIVGEIAEFAPAGGIRGNVRPPLAKVSFKFEKVSNVQNDSVALKNPQ